MKIPLLVFLAAYWGGAFVQGLRCHFISMPGKSPMKLEVTSRHDHSCLLGRKASKQTNYKLLVFMSEIKTNLTPEKIKLSVSFMLKCRKNQLISAVNEKENDFFPRHFASVLLYPTCLKGIILGVN